MLCACSKTHTSPDAPPTVYRENSVELVLRTRTLSDGRVVMQLHKDVFVHNSERQDTVLYTDTLPSLGKDTYYVRDEDDDGNVNEHSETGDKQYDILFKVDSLR